MPTQLGHTITRTGFKWYGSQISCHNVIHSENINQCHMHLFLFTTSIVATIPQPATTMSGELFLKLMHYKFLILLDMKINGLNYSQLNKFIYCKFKHFAEELERISKATI